jgi:hypothetical protein
MDLRARMKVLINEVFHWMLKLHCFKVFVGSKICFELQVFVAEKFEKFEINLFENLHS